MACVMGVGAALSISITSGLQYFPSDLAKFICASTAPDMIIMGFEQDTDEKMQGLCEGKNLIQLNEPEYLEQAMDAMVDELEEREKEEGWCLSHSMVRYIVNAARRREPPHGL